MKPWYKINKLIISLLVGLSFVFSQNITVEGDIVADETWTADNTYFLNNQAFVKDGVTLTIEAGVTVFGRYDANYSADNPAPCLVVERGGKIMAEGTAAAPITFKSELESTDANYGNGRGLWGGLIINGRAPISNSGGEASVEGLTGILYGGTDPTDNSGVLRYVRVWNGGSAIAPDNEINGITLAGVGNGTTVEYCEVALNLDDGFEMFGGTVNLKHCVVVAVGDDAFDTDGGYQGMGQFLVVVRADDSDKAHEMDSKTNGDLDSQPRSHPQYANVTVISSTGGEDLLRLREGTGGDFRNYLLMGGNDGVRNDDNGSEVVTQDLGAALSAGHPNYLYISPNITMNDIGGDPWDDFDEATDASWSGSFDSGDAGLEYTVDLNGMPATLDITPSAAGSAYDNVDVPLEDTFFEDVYYRGAFGPNNWLLGWSWLDETGVLYNQAETVVALGGELTEDLTLQPANTYFLDQQLFVKEGVTLTIEPGVTIFGRYDANYSADNPAPCLVVERGGKIMAEGTAAAPITFKSELESTDANYGNGRGLWGGLIINGRAPISNSGGEASVEGLTGILYGGTDPTDNSGVLRYVRVWNGGSAIAPDNEINGITLAGVGNGTTVSFCEVALNADDGFEMFGGTVDLHHCVVVAVGDDAFDTDNGYQGRGQYLVVVRADDSDKAHEMDNKTDGDFDSQPRSHPSFFNVTVMSSAGGEDMLRLREGTGGTFSNYIIHGGNDGVRNDDNGTEVVTQDWLVAEAAGHPDFLYFSANNIMNNIAGVPWDDFDETDETWSGNYEAGDAGLDIQVDANGMPEMVDLTPSAGSAAYSSVDPIPYYAFGTEDSLFYSWFDTPTHKGAFGNQNWLEGWSWLSEQGILYEQQEEVVALGGDLVNDLHLTYGGSYFLYEQLFVKDGAELHIDAGVTIYGRYDANYNADNPAPCVVVERGGKIFAEGTVNYPITFRSELSPGDANYGDGKGLWGGLIINGRAPIANSGGEANVEGLIGVPYGGTDPDDNSGVLRYVRVWNGGSAIAPDNEINGVTLAGVGRGTTVEFCEVALNKDDGFEMFGGTVDLRNLSVVNVGDDAYDIDAGYQGRVQNLFIKMDAGSDRGHEMDSKTNGDFDSQPRTHPLMSNVTILGPGGTDGGDLVKAREGCGGVFVNYLMVDGGTDGFDNSDNGTELVTQDLSATAGLFPDFIYWSSQNIIANTTNTFGGTAASFTADTDDPQVRSNTVDLVDPRPSDGSSAYRTSEYVPFTEDGFFEQYSYRGAFGTHNWLKGWSWLDEQGVLGTDPIGTEDIVELNSGWNLISLDIDPNLSLPSEIFGGALHEVLYISSPSGYFQPGDAFATLTEMIPGQAYYAKMQVSENIMNAGSDLNLTYSLNAGWNLIAYEPDMSHAPQDAFASLISSGTLEYVSGFDGGALLYDPNQLPFLNTLDVMENGLGYWVKVNAPVDFSYPAGTARIASNQSTHSKPIKDHRDKELNATPVYMFLNGSINGKEQSFDTNTRVKVKTKSGLLVGSMKIHEQKWLITSAVYGDDPTTVKVDGAIEGEELILDLNGDIVGSIVFASNTVQTTSVNVDEVTPSSYALLAPYPNPFNPSTSFSYNIPSEGFVSIKIYDLSGRMVNELVSENQTAGKYSITWTGVNNIGKPVSSGTYFIQMNASGFNSVSKVMFIK